MGKYKHVGLHAEELVGGVMVGPGEELDLDEQGEEDNKRLIDEGIIVSQEAESKQKRSTKKEEE